MRFSALHHKEFRDCREAFEIGNGRILGLLCFDSRVTVQRTRRAGCVKHLRYEIVNFQVLQPSFIFVLRRHRVLESRDLLPNLPTECT